MEEREKELAALIEESESKQKILIYLIKKYFNKYRSWKRKNKN